MGSPTRTIRSSADAVDAATALRERYRHAHAVAILDAHGRVLDLTPFRRATETVDDALNWANCLVSDDERATKMVLLSAVSDVMVLREEDARTLKLAQTVFARYDIEIVDWVQCDGTWTRSIGRTIGTDTWQEDGEPVEATMSGDGH